MAPAGIEWHVLSMVHHKSFEVSWGLNTLTLFHRARSLLFLVIQVQTAVQRSTDFSYTEYRNKDFDSLVIP